MLSKFGMCISQQELQQWYFVFHFTKRSVKGKEDLKIDWQLSCEFDSLTESCSRCTAESYSSPARRTALQTSRRIKLILQTRCQRRRQFYAAYPAKTMSITDEGATGICKSMNGQWETLCVEAQSEETHHKEDQLLIEISATALADRRVGQSLTPLSNLLWHLRPNTHNSFSDFFAAQNAALNSYWSKTRAQWHDAAMSEDNCKHCSERSVDSLACPRRRAASSH